MEIGSFIELDIRDSGEYYPGNKDIARLNSARAGIFHACRVYNCSKVYLPYYLCSVVKKFLKAKDIEIGFYHISETFEPIAFRQEPGSAVVIVNYFGMLSRSTIESIAGKFSNVIIDNGPAFYSKPIKEYYQVYSPRKFFGVPDGCYVIGRESERYVPEYSQDFSSDTSGFLLKRIEYGSGASYGDRMKNEARIDGSDILRMSSLSESLLKGIDYEGIKTRRLANFEFAHSLFGEMNLLDPVRFTDKESVPMVYPLVIEDPDAVKKLQGQKIYTGRWWNHVIDEVRIDTFEAWLSKFMIPVPIDQRYGEEAIRHVFMTLIQDY